MEIGRISGTKEVKTEDRKVVSSRKQFSQSFNQARERKSQDELKKMAENIKKRGNRWVLTKTYADVKI